MILSKPPAFNGFDLTLPEAVCFWTSQLLMEHSQHLGELITNYGFPLPLPQAITLRASQLFYFLGYGELNTIQFSANYQPSTDLSYLYQEPFAPGLACPFVG
jgi:hypothetical protein